MTGWPAASVTGLPVRGRPRALAGPASRTSNAIGVGAPGRGGVEVDVVGHQEVAGPDHRRAGRGVELARAEVGAPLRIVDLLGRSPRIRRPGSIARFRRAGSGWAASYR